jgi:hypothetical protein
MRRRAAGGLTLVELLVVSGLIATALRPAGNNYPDPDLTRDGVAGFDTD